MKAVVAAFNQEKALVGALSVITNLRMDLELLQDTHLGPLEPGEAEAAAGDVVAHGAVVAVALAPAVQVVGAGGAGVGAHLALHTPQHSGANIFSDNCKYF